MAFALLALAALAPGGAAPPQAPEDVAGQVSALWKANKIPQLAQYLQAKSATAPDYAPAVVAGAMCDYIFLGKLYAAKAKLLRISAVAAANPEVFPEVYQGYLAAALSKLNDEIRIQLAHGTTEQDWQANANPQAVRNTIGTNGFPIMTLLLVTPKVTLPSR